MNPVAQIVAAYKRHLWSLIIFSAVMNVLMLLLPIYSLQVFDRVVSSASVDTLIMLTLIVLVSFVAFGVLYMVRSLMMASTNGWIDTHVVPDLLRKSILQSSGHGRVAMGYHMRQLGSIKQFANTHAINFFFDLPFSVLFLGVIYMVHPYQGILCTLGIVVIVSVALVYEMLICEDIKASDDSFAQNINMADEAARNAESVLTLGMTPNIIRNWFSNYQQHLGYYHKVQVKSSMLLSFLKTIRYMVQVLVVGLGVYLVLQNDLTLGGVIACSVLVSRALVPFETSTMAWKSFVEARKAYDALKEVFPETDQTMDSLVELPKPKGNIHVKEATLLAPTTGMPILRQITFKVAAGQSMVIIGRNAAGKSTLAKLLVGALIPNKGEVRLDGVDVRFAAEHDLGKHIGYLPQVPQLFNASVAENIARMDKGAIDSNEMLRVTSMLNMHDMIMHMPMGYETPLGSDGFMLSTGQRQAIALARAFYGNPAFVVLDEPNAYLDRQTEAGLQQALDQAKEQGTTVVIISHSKWLIDYAQSAMVLEQGQIKMMGPKEKILQRLTENANV